MSDVREEERKLCLQTNDSQSEALTVFLVRFSYGSNFPLTVCLSQ